MPPQVATFVYVGVICALFLLDREAIARFSTALWVPVGWLLLIGSRPPAEWLYRNTAAISADTVNIESNPLNVLVYSILLATGTTVLAARRRQIGKLLRANWPILLFFSYCALSTLWSEYPAAALRKWVRSLGDLIMILIIWTELEPGAALKCIYASTGFILLPLSVLFIKYYPALGRSYSNSWVQMYNGVTTHKNTLGSVCLVIGLGFLWRFLDHWKGSTARRRRHLLVDCVMLAMVLWLLWKANSVTSSVCFAMGSAVMLVSRLSFARRRAWAMHFVVAGLVGLALFAVFLDTGGDLVQTVGRNPTLTGRTAIWEQVLDMAQNPVFGTGFESFWLGDRLETMWNDHVGIRLNEAHNGYIEVYLNLGWCGVVLLSLIIAKGYRTVIGNPAVDSHLRGLMLAYLVAALNYAHSEAAFRMTSNMWAYFLLAAAAVPGVLARKTLCSRRETAAPHYIHEQAGVA